MKKTYLAVFVVSFQLAGCVSSDTEKLEKVGAVGSDKDQYGCIGSAGYSWCARSERCERPWELAGRAGFPNTQEDFVKYCFE